MTTPQHLDPATLVTALYCIIDDLYREFFAHLKPVRRGRRPELSDSEVLTLVVLTQWRPDRSERAFLEYAKIHLRAFFPRLLHQSSFNRRARDLSGALSAMGPAIRRRAIEVLELPLAAYEVVDGVPVPLMKRCRGVRHLLYADEAGIGRGGSDRDWYYGAKMVAGADEHGFMTGFVAGPANTEERWLAEALFRWRVDPTLPVPKAADLAQVLGPTHRAGGQRKGPTGPLGPRMGVGECSLVVTLADLNYAGTAWNQHWRQSYDAIVLTQAEYRNLDKPERDRACRQLHSMRQTIESSFNLLVGSFGLKFPRARSLWGLHTRLGAKVAAYNLNVFLNLLAGNPTYSLVKPLG